MATTSPKYSVYEQEKRERMEMIACQKSLNSFGGKWRPILVTNKYTRSATLQFVDRNDPMKVMLKKNTNEPFEKKVGGLM